ncbi:MAG: calcium-binding protein [Aquabacterium sp.]|nr:calcium-binding protein [Aquabacterium sp.]
MPTINGDNNANVLTAGDNSQHIINGWGGNDTLTALGGNDLLDGGTGADNMTGGFGSDTYTVDNVGDQVNEGLFGGTDTVRSHLANYTLGANVENLVLQPQLWVMNPVSGLLEIRAAAVNGTGNALNNVITGNSGANTIDGGAGADTMSGLGGNDTYIVDNAGDTVIEAAGGGTDLVRSSVSWVLGAEVENLTLTGAAAINGTGNALNNVIFGNGAANVIDGRAGADTMDGGLGNDTYYVDNNGDVVSEVWAFGGTDQVYSRAGNHTLGNNIENLTLLNASFSIDPVTGLLVLVPGGVNGTGNALNNVITGNTGSNVLNGMAGNDTIDGGAGNDTIDGGTGADAMTGGSGNDLFIVDNAADTVSELAGGGTDTVQSSVSYTITDVDVENLTLTGVAYSAVGNASANTLTGNASGNWIDGQGGADTMRGEAGNDTYVVDNALDQVLEDAAEGIDTVRASVSHGLADVDVENLTLTGVANLNGTGNAVNNVLQGNSGINTLLGLAGNDVLWGHGGNDTLQGGTGADDLHGGLGVDTLRAVDAVAGVNDFAVDRFFFDTAAGAANADSIQMASFGIGNEATDDQIVLENAIFTGLLTAGGVVGGVGTLSAANYFEGAGAFFEGSLAGQGVGIWVRTDTNQAFYNGDLAAGSLLFAAVNAGGVPGGAAALSAEEFTLV